MNFEERWVKIEEFPNYAVSDYGRVMNCMTGRILAQSYKSTGYLRVGLRINNVCKMVRVHRLVAKAFIYTNSYSLDINHIDGNKLNNWVENLEWCTPTENAAHAVRLGLITPPILCKPVRCVETDEFFPSVTEAAKYFNLHQSTVSQNILGHIKRTRQGYSFELVD